MCSKLIFCSKIAQKDKKFPEVAIEPQNVASDAKSYSKGAEYNRDRPNDDDEDSLEFSKLLVRSITL